MHVKIPNGILISSRASDIRECLSRIFCSRHSSSRRKARYFVGVVGACSPVTTVSQSLAGYFFAPIVVFPLSRASSDFKRFPPTKAALSHFCGSLLMKDKSRYFTLNRGVRVVYLSPIRARNRRHRFLEEFLDHLDG